MVTLGKHLAIISEHLNTVRLIVLSRKLIKSWKEVQPNRVLCMIVDSSCFFSFLGFTSMVLIALQLNYAALRTESVYVLKPTRSKRAHFR